MELLQLRYFCAVAECENVTAAARALMISQPALSMSIKKLEEDIGTALFDRVKNRIFLNKQGRAFYEQVKAGLSSIDSGIEELREGAGVGTKRVRLLASSATSLLGDLCKQYCILYPDVELSVDDPRHTDEALPLHSFDIIISEYDAVKNGYAHEVLIEEEMGITVPADHPLAGREEADFAEFAKYPFLASSKGTNIRRRFDKLCEATGIYPAIVLEIDHISMYSSCSNLGAMMTPYNSYKALFGDIVKFIRIRRPVSRRKIAISWAEGKYMTRPVQDFKNLCIDHFKRLSESAT